MRRHVEYRCICHFSNVSYLIKKCFHAEPAAAASTKKVEDKKGSIKGELKEKRTTEDVAEPKVSDSEPPEDEKEDLRDQPLTRDDSDTDKQPETAEEIETGIKTQPELAK